MQLETREKRPSHPPAGPRDALQKDARSERERINRVGKDKEKIPRKVKQKRVLKINRYKA